MVTRFRILNISKTARENWFEAVIEIDSKTETFEVELIEIPGYGRVGISIPHLPLDVQMYLGDPHQVKINGRRRISIVIDTFFAIDRGESVSLPIAFPKD